MCILDLSKVLINEFHYDYIKSKCSNNSRLLFTETDSLMYEIKTKDVYQDFSCNKEMSDFSNYLIKSKYHNDWNKLVIGTMNDETTTRVAIEEFAGLKSKMYSFLIDNNSEYKKAKEVNRNIVEKITHNEYKDVLLNNNFIRHSMNRDHI